MLVKRLSILRLQDLALLKKFLLGRWRDVFQFSVQQLNSSCWHSLTFPLWLCNRWCFFVDTTAHWSPYLPVDAKRTLAAYSDISPDCGSLKMHPFFDNLMTIFRTPNATILPLKLCFTSYFAQTPIDDLLTLPISFYFWINWFLQFLEQSSMQRAPGSVQLLRTMPNSSSPIFSNAGDMDCFYTALKNLRSQIFHRTGFLKSSD